MVEAMAGYIGGTGAAVISLGLSQGVHDCLPFYWRGFKVVPHYTYRIDLKQDVDTILSALSKNRRNDVRKAQKDGVVVEEATDTDEMIALVHATFARSGKAFPYQVMKAILAAFPPEIREKSHVKTHTGS